MQTKLPSWARFLSGFLPATTACMVKLDTLHRTGDRLEPRLRGLVRWAAADANGCAYSRAVALADLGRAQVSTADLRMLADNPDRVSVEERLAMDFARKMMRAAHTVTDEELGQLLTMFGEERVVALVSLLAHASFQDRLLLAARIEVGPDDLLPPEGYKTGGASTVPPVTTVPRSASMANEGIRHVENGASEWPVLREKLQQQKRQEGRIRVPTREEVRKRLREDHPGLWQLDILWSRVCFGYQPELTEAWFACVAAFRQEARMDRIFEQSLFWIVTRSLQCFY